MLTEKEYSVQIQFGISPRRIGSGQVDVVDEQHVDELGPRGSADGDRVPPGGKCDKLGLFNEFRDMG